MSPAWRSSPRPIATSRRRSGRGGSWPRSPPRRLSPRKEAAAGPLRGGRQTAAELTEYETRLGKAGGIQPSTPFGTTSTPANDDSPRRSAIVIVHIRKMVQRQREQAADGEAHRHLHAEAAAGRLDKDGGAAHGGVQHVGLVSAARQLVHLLLGHPLVDEARRTLRLVLRDVPSAGPPAGRSGLNQRPAGATAKADRAAAVILFPRLWRQTDLLPVCRIDLAEG